MPISSDSLSVLAAKYEQIVIYGAKGWLGLSSLEALQYAHNNILTNKCLLIGSKTEKVSYKSHEIQIFSANDSLNLVEKKVLFLNFAFLRQEKLNSMKRSDYISQNFKIMELPKVLLLRKAVQTFVNISSGAANFSRNLSEPHTLEPYSTLKRVDEIWTKDLCEYSKTELINCRLYSMSGKYINEFDNLAFSLFIKEAITNQEIVVRSPDTIRTYIDGVDLIEVLLLLALEGRNIDIDSGGARTTLGNLANQVAERLQGTSVVLADSKIRSPDYFGDYLRFNVIASDRQRVLKNLSEQIDETLKAFNF